MPNPGYALSATQLTAFLSACRRLRPRHAQAGLAKAAIIKRLHPHGLGHSYASGVVREGIPLYAISKSLGHASSAVASTYLDHIAPADVIAVGRSRTWIAEEQ